MRNDTRIHTNGFLQWILDIINAADQVNSNVRGPAQMYMIGSTKGRSRHPMLISKNKKTNELEKHMLWRPCKGSRPGHKGFEIQKTDQFFSRLVKVISDKTLKVVQALAQEYDYYKEVLEDILFVQHRFPEELKVCNSIFTQQIVLRIMKKGDIRAIFKHYDKNDLYGAVYLQGLTKTGGDFQFYDNVKWTKEKNIKANLVHSIPFEAGLLVIGPYDKVLHSVSEWDGEIVFLNLHLSRDVIHGVRTHGWKAYAKYASLGFPSGKFEAPTF